ncbi:MAG TPA: hypothetical protein VFE19_10070 [Jatrophihabitantaceae bacterium]|jgi:hypothetical protein|nr:hypothetical protein [Jatrophihabitantaceae bacterium]
MYLTNTMPTATPLPRATQLIAPFGVVCTGAISALGTPAFGSVAANVRVRDGKLAAPPRGELR